MSSTITHGPSTKMPTRWAPAQAMEQSKTGRYVPYYEYRNEVNALERRITQLKKRIREMEPDGTQNGK